jgi:tripartite-type tricarboxylate transporter receptor subunit TctC
MTKRMTKVMESHHAWFLKAVVWGALIATSTVPATPVLAQADAYPSRPVRMIVPYNPGAAVDIAARMIARGLSDQTGKTVVVENRPGAGSLIGAESVARSDPDGYTLLFVPDDTFTILPHLTKTQAFDANKQLTAVIEVGKIINIMVVNTSIPPKTLPELIEYARARPTELSYGSNGPGGAAHLAMEMLKSKAKIDLVHVPYKGNAPALQGIAGGEVQVGLIGYGSTRGLIDQGKLRPIVVAGADREPGLPNLPTTVELGYPDVDVTTRLIIAVPNKTPPAIVQQIGEAFSRVVQNPETRTQMQNRNLVVTNVGMQELAQGIAYRYQASGEAVRISGARLD